jgi:lipopolysaccharide/colanic/teichoic acid biosynthesis glycosyltransferase
MPEMYSLMDILVLPSHREGFPRAPMEALTMGVPCIVTDVRGCREVVEHGRNGLLVPPGDVRALAAAIIELLANRERAREMGAEGRRVALERFDERLVFQRVGQEYTRLLREKARRRGGQASRVAYPGKRFLDLAVALPALLVLSPLMGLIALLVRLLMGPPVLFRQQRPGLHGAPFTLLKFRTMTNARDEQGNLLSDAERLTPFGRFLRATSLDELPELINVVKGEMSLVGPRPLLMEYLDRYTPEQMRRHEVKPGITGWAQVNGRNALTWEEKLALDVWYVDHQTLALDLRILCLTIWKLLRREGIAHPGYATAPKFMGPASGAESERGGEPR